MKRSTFFKSLIAVIAAPKILSEIKWAKPKPKTVTPLFEQLQLLKPTYYKQYVDKYANEDFTWWLNEIGKTSEVTTREFHYFNSETGETFTSPIAGPPVTITITKENHG